MNGYKFDFNDILIVPEQLTTINSRDDVNVYDDNGMLPLFTSPMDTVINFDNYHYFEENKIYGAIPRTEWFKAIPSASNMKCWLSVGLSDFEKEFIDKPHDANKLEKPIYIIIDIANGHMEKLFDVLKKAKEIYGLNEKLYIIAGNTGSPKAIKNYVGLCWGVRVGIGHGSGCLTTEQTAVGYPMASLIQETYLELQHHDKEERPKIIADGGFRGYSDIIKALALGADYVIMGGIFNKALESAGDTILRNIKHDGWIEPGPKIDQYDPKYAELLKSGTEFFKLYRGMSTKEVQRKLRNEKIKTAEGITKLNKVEYTLNGWTENFIHYLRSAMSYTNSRNLIEFIGKTEFIYITQNAYNRYHK